jgi:hypothetical protein
MRIATFVTTAVVVGAVLAMGQALAGRDEIKPFIKVPKTWQAAVEEGKQLNTPIVWHNHGWH